MTPESPPETGLAELGMDSLMAVELSTRLQQQLGADFAVPPTLAFDYPSVAALADHLLGLLKAVPEVEEAPTTVDQEVARDDVAIIGLGCRFPGADNIEEYWQLLEEGVDAIGEVPKDRWDREKFFQPGMSQTF